MKGLLSISTIALALMISLNSCGGGNKTDEATASAVSAEEQTAPNTLELEGNDEMQFSKTEMHVTAGQKITLTFKHTGKMDKTVMGHDFVLLKQGTDVNAFAHEAMSARDTGFIPKSREASVIAHTRLLGGGESDTIQFSVAEKGTYDYICSFPGHSALMKGKLIVE